MKLDNVQDPVGAPGAIPLRLRNVAPQQGDREVGLVPFGLTALLAPNGKGKSRALEAVLAIPLEATHPEDLLTIQRGQSEALAGLGTAEIRITTRETGAGKTRTRTDRSGETSQGPIHKLPDPVGKLVTGGDHVSPDANWRCRLEALLNVAPADVTEASLSELAGVLPEPDGDVAAALIERHTAKPFPDLLAAADWLADGKSALLHTRKRAAKSEAETLGLDVERLLGKMAEIERAAAAASGVSDPAAIKRLLLDESAAGAPAEFSVLESAFALLTVRVQEQDRTRKEREQIRAGLGERPSAVSEEAANARAAEAEAEAAKELAVARASAAEANGRLSALQSAAEPLRDAVVDRAVLWWDSAAALRDTLAIVNGPPPVALAAEMVRGATRLHEAVVESEAALLAVGEAGVRATEAGVAVAVAERRLAARVEEHRVASANLAAAIARQESWGRTVARLDEPLPALFPSAADLDVWADVYESVPGEPSEADLGGEILSRAKAKLDALRPRAKAAASGPAYRTAEAERLRLYAAKTAAEDRAERLEAEVSRVWDRLAEIISESLHSDVLRVSPGRLIEIRLSDGRWVDVADDVEASRGTIRRAMLSFYLDRVPPGERNIVLPDAVMLPIDQQGREEISRIGASKQLRLMFEQPVLGDVGDDTEIRCIFYGGAA